jgi:thymidylate kinase
MEQEDAGFYEAVRRGYLDLAREYPGRITLIDASLDEEGVAALISNKVSLRLEGQAHGVI